MLYACDPPWWDFHIESVRRVFHGERWTQSEPAAKKHGLSAVKGEPKPGLGRTSVHFGGNSGYQALNLAFLWGAARIVLVGYDMQKTGGKSHWHGDHPKRLAHGLPVSNWVHRFSALADDLKAEGVDVINCSRATALKCFAMQPLEEVLCYPSS